MGRFYNDIAKFEMKDWLAHIVVEIWNKLMVLYILSQFQKPWKFII